MTDTSSSGAAAQLPRPAEDRAEYLLELLGALYPSGRVATTPGWRQGGDDYLLLPSSSRPTVCVPARPRSGAAEVVRGYKPSADRATRFQLSALAAATRSGAMRLWPHRLVLDKGQGESIETYLAAALGVPVSVAVYTSPPRANRKPVLRVLTAQGAPLAFAKLGVNPLTSRLVVSEADALAVLAARGFATVLAPELMHRGRWNGMDVVVQRDLAVQAPRSPSAGVLDAAVAEISALGRTDPQPVRGSAYVAGLRSRLAAHPHPDQTTGLLQALAEVESLADTTAVSLRFGSWHGDWTPWNMTSDGSRAIVWDWERFEGGVPVGYDAAHYHTQLAIVRRRVAPLDATQGFVATAPGVLGPFVGTRRAAQVTALLYLIEVGTRYTVDGQAEAGARLGNLNAWLLPALRSGIDALAGARA